MKYCNLSYGGGIGSAAIEMGNRSAYINHCCIGYSSYSGIYGHANYVFDTSTVKNSNGVGLMMYTNGTDCNILIQLDSFLNNAGGAVSLQGCTIKVTNNYFKSNSKVSGSPFGTLNLDCENAIVTNNYMEDNSNSVAEGVIYTSGQPTIECNTFINNHATCIYVDSDMGSVVRDNVFRGNTCNYSASTILYSAGDSNGNIYFEGNSISNNISTTLYGPSCWFSTDITDSRIHINNNDFRNNIQSSIIKISSTNLVASTINFLEMKHNNFLDPGQIEFFNNIPYGTNNVTLDSNYWGSASTAHLDSVVYDYFDDGNLSIVFYNPLLSTPIVVDITCAGSITSGVPVISPDASTINIYPNPTASQFIITLPTINGLLLTTITITDVLGKTVHTTTAKETKQLNITLNQPPGIYFVSVIADGKRIVKKLVID